MSAREYNATRTPVERGSGWDLAVEGYERVMWPTAKTLEDIPHYGATPGLELGLPVGAGFPPTLTSEGRLVGGHC